MPDRPPKILVAEDISTNRLVVERMLKHLGYEHIEYAEDGQQAIGCCRDKKYDVVLMDMQMPQVDGLEATREILSDAAAYGNPVIIGLTANAFETHKQSCLEAGMKDFLSKPIIIAELKSVMQKFAPLDI